MNKRRKVLITITYNEMGIIIDTKAEEVAQPNLQSTCNELATDCISRQAAIDALDCINGVEEVLKALPSAQPEIIRCKDCKWYGRSDKRRFYRGMDCLQKRIDTIVPDKDFCSRAERREE